MSKELYESVSSFSTYEEKKKECNAGIDMVNITSCNSSIFGKDCDDEHFKRNYLIAEKYLANLEVMGNSPKVEDACKYFSYWAYKEMLKEKKIYSYSVPELLKIIMQNKDDYICKDYVEDITHETFLNIEKLIDLYEKYFRILDGDDIFDCERAKVCVEKYKGFEDTCYLKIDDPFCKGIEKFRGVYNKTMERRNYCPQYKILPPFQERPEKSANTIATAAITAISFASIMTYKFTPLGPWVRQRLSGNKNLRNKLEKEFTASKNSSELQDMEYRVPYNSS